MNSTTEIALSEISPGGRASISGSGAIIFFDGVCNLCNGWVQFVIRRDPKAVFRFAPLQSDVAKAALSGVKAARGLDSIVLLEGDRIFVRSSAVLHIVRRLRWPWPLLSIFLVVPRWIRDAVYDYVAARRYRWFGRRDACMVPTPDLEDRFIRA